MVLDKAAVAGVSYGLILTSVRQRDAVKRAAEALARAVSATAADLIPLDVIYADIKEAWTAFGSVTGTATPEAIIDNLFSRFCVGK